MSASIAIHNAYIFNTSSWDGSIEYCCTGHGTHRAQDTRITWALVVECEMWKWAKWQMNLNSIACVKFIVFHVQCSIEPKWFLMLNLWLNSSCQFFLLPFLIRSFGFVSNRRFPYTFHYCDMHRKSDEQNYSDCLTSDCTIANKIMSRKIWKTKLLKLQSDLDLDFDLANDVIDDFFAMTVQTSHRSIFSYLTW